MYQAQKNYYKKNQEALKTKARNAYHFPPQDILLLPPLYPNLLSIKLYKKRLNNL